MGFELSKPKQTYNLVTAQTRASLDRYTNSRDNARAQREAAKQAIAQRVYGYKAALAIELTTQLELHAFTSAEQLIRDVVNKLNEGGRSPQEQAFLEQMAGDLLSQYRDIIPTIVNIGSTNIAQEASKSIEPPEERRWLR